MSEIEETLKERGDRYGPFTTHAAITQELKSAVKTDELIDRLFRSVEAEEHTYEEAMAVMESIDMICHKLGRIANGDPYYADSWVDIEGYARLITKMLEEK